MIVDGFTLRLMLLNLFRRFCSYVITLKWFCFGFLNAAASFAHHNVRTSWFGEVIISLFFRMLILSSGWFRPTSLRSSWASEQLGIFFEPLQFHLEVVYLLEQLSFLGLAPSLCLFFLPNVNSLLAPSSSCFFHWHTWMGWIAWSEAISWIVLRPLIAMATRT